MTEISDRKTFWTRSTMEIITFTEGTLMDIIQLARKDILSLITTIESQNAGIKEYEFYIKNVGLPAQEENKQLKTQVESQKEEIERLLAIIAEKEDKSSDYFDQEGDK